MVHASRRTVVIVSADAEWAEVKRIFAGAPYQSSAYGEFFREGNVIVFHGGWGKISAAASTQYAIDRWDPEAILNLGTCGGIEGAIEQFTLVLATRTVVYDIRELMGNSDVAIAFYSTDLGFNPQEQLPAGVVTTALYSADRDLAPEEVASLASRGARAVDWESGAIAWVAKRNRKPVLIVRGVSDLVSPDGGLCYGNITHFHDATARVMRSLFAALPEWLALLPPGCADEP